MAGLVAAFALPLAAQGNPRATAKLSLNGKDVSVEYGRPSLKGRASSRSGTSSTRPSRRTQPHSRRSVSTTARSPEKSPEPVSKKAPAKTVRPEQPPVPWPRPYKPSEEISADSAVPFPTDI